MFITKNSKTEDCSHKVPENDNTQQS